MALVANVAAIVATPAAGASPQRSATIERGLPVAGGAAVSLYSPPGERRPTTLLRFPRNRVALWRLADGRLVLNAGGRHRLIHARRQRPVRVRIKLDVAASSVTARATGRRVKLTLRLQDETSVIVARNARRVAVRPLGKWQPPNQIGRPALPSPGPAPSGFQPPDQIAVERGGAALPSAGPAPIGPQPGTQAEPPGSWPESPLFALDSVWNQPLPADAALDPSNDVLVKTLRDLVAQNIEARSGPAIATKTTSPLYVVPADQPTVRVQLDTGSWGATLQQALEAVPIPANAVPADGPDRHLTIWQPSRDRLWEFFHASKLSDGWHAEWGGAIASVSRSPGYYTTDSWPGLSRSWWGATATSLPVIAGTMMIDEMNAGVIPHALAINIPNARSKVYSWPAQRTDGKTIDPNAIPEGARFRLDPTLDISKLNLKPMTRMMAEAAQRYGMIVRDQTSTALGFFAENPTQYGTTPYSGPDGFFGGKWSGATTRDFPWEHLQLVKMDLHTMK